MAEMTIECRTCHDPNILLRESVNGLECRACALLRTSPGHQFVLAEHARLLTGIRVRNWLIVGLGLLWIIKG